MRGAPHRAYLVRYGTGIARNPHARDEPRARSGWRRPAYPSATCELTREWLGIHGERSAQPEASNTRNAPITGFDCPRGEVSGRRLWSWARTRFCRTPETLLRALLRMELLSALLHGGIRGETALPTSCRRPRAQAALCGMRRRARRRSSVRSERTARARYRAVRRGPGPRRARTRMPCDRERRAASEPRESACQSRMGRGVRTRARERRGRGPDHCRRPRGSRGGTGSDAR